MFFYNVFDNELVGNYSMPCFSFSASVCEAQLCLCVQLVVSAGLICAPTRELSMQIYSEAKRFGKAYGLRVVCAYGGGNKYEQCKALNEGAEIVVCTPGRLIDCIKANATNLQRVTFLVFDEADRMFDLGFGPQVRSIAGHVRPDRQALMFSATFKPKVEELAKVVLNNPVRIVQGEVGDVNEGRLIFG